MWNINLRRWWVVDDQVILRVEPVRRSPRTSLQPTLSPGTNPHMAHRPSNGLRMLWEAPPHPILPCTNPHIPPVLFFKLPQPSDVLLNSSNLPRNTLSSLIHSPVELVVKQNLFGRCLFVAAYWRSRERQGLMTAVYRSFPPATSCFILAFPPAYSCIFITFPPAPSCILLASLPPASSTIALVLPHVPALISSVLRALVLVPWTMKMITMKETWMEEASLKEGQSKKNKIKMVNLIWQIFLSKHSVLHSYLDSHSARRNLMSQKKLGTRAEDPLLLLWNQSDLTSGQKRRWFCGADGRMGRRSNGTQEGTWSNHHLQSQSQLNQQFCSKFYNTDTFCNLWYYSLKLRHALDSRFPRKENLHFSLAVFCWV